MVARYAVTQKSANAISPAGWSLTQKEWLKSTPRDIWNCCFFISRLDETFFLFFFVSLKLKGMQVQLSKKQISKFISGKKALIHLESSLRSQRLHKHSLTNRCCDTKILTCDVSKPLDSIRRNLCVFVCIQSWKIPREVFYSIQVSWIVWLGLANATAQVVCHRRRVKMPFFTVGKGVSSRIGLSPESIPGDPGGS